jgi:TolB-like protein
MLTKILIVGFPIALVLAWLYELTPKGFKRTGTYQEDTEDNKKAGRRLNYFIIGILAVAVCFLLVDKVFISGSNNTDERQEAGIANLPDFTSSIAVLAFDDMSPNKDQEYLSDGISEEILNYLAKYRDLNVKSRTSSFAYKGKDVTIDVIGEELGVAYVLQGSVRKGGDTYRITVQLIDTKDGAHIWSDTFDRKIEDVLFVQDEIASIVANRLNLTLSNQDVRLRKVDPEAYDLYLQSVFELHLYTQSSALKADSLIRRSTSIDPNYAPAWSALSMTTLHKGLYYHQLDKDEAVSIGIDAAEKSIELDSTYYPGYNWLSNWQWHGRNGKASLQTLETLLELYQNDEGVLEYATHAYIRMGMIDNAIATSYRGIQLYPKSPWVHYYTFWLEYSLGNYQQAIQALLTYNKLYKKSTGQEQHLALLAWLYFKTGDAEKALMVLEREPVEYSRKVIEAMIYYKKGRMVEADSLMTELKAIPTEEINSLGENLDWDLAIIHASKGDIDKSFEHLYKAYDQILIYTELLFVFEELTILHDDSRWQALLDRLGEEFNFDYNAP